MRRVAYWTAVLVALAAMGAGGWYAYDAYRATSAPEAKVRAYFAALARSDAPAALALGDIPAGPHGLLTSQVLAEQQRIAPLHDLHILDVAEDGSAATVRYSYQLRFPRGNQEFTGSLALTRGGHGWRLAAVAVPVAITVDQARDRFTFAGAGVPDGLTVMFPGALPIRFDTANLQVDQSTAAVQFDGDRTLDVSVEASAAARAALTTKLAALVRTCLSNSPAANCPTPPGRVVPGTLAGTLVGALSPKLTFSVGASAGGTIDLSAKIVVSGRYQELAYDNVATQHSGRIALVLAARSSAKTLGVQFTEPSS